MPLLKLCYRTFLVGDVLKIERMNGKKMVVRIEKVFGDNEFEYWDVFELASWEGAPCLVTPRMCSNEVRTVRKLGAIPDDQLKQYIAFMFIYQRVKMWEEELS
ncbi:MAG: hypothetical protein HYT98_02915 [Candidatus Sungbacteria bacterium]|nr:hypothetical protein [Candidatus Sungbacteria bacterium]